MKWFVSMKDFKLTLSSLGCLVTELTKLLKNSNKSYRVNVVEWREKRSLSQNALFHVWVGELSNYLISKGRKDAGKEFSKDLLKHTFLGYEDVKRVNALTGEVVFTSTLKQTSKLGVGEMTYFMSQCYSWCLDIGLMLPIPETSEYYQLMQSQTE